MTQPPPPKPKQPAAKPNSRDARLAEALRKNLLRRKAAHPPQEKK
jgi:hypothetical protein